MSRATALTIRTIIEAILLTLFDIPPTPPSWYNPSTTGSLVSRGGVPRRGHFLVYYGTQEKNPLDIYVPIGGFLFRVLPVGSGDAPTLHRVGAS